MKDLIPAKRYAAAFFELAAKKKLEPKVEEELLAFVTNILGKKELAQFFNHPAIATKEKLPVLQKVTAGKMNKISIEFISLLMEKKRLGLLPAVVEAYHELLNNSLHFEEVEVVTARPLPKKTLESLEKILEKKIGEKIISKTKIDSSYIGGISVKIRNRRYDGSLRKKLDNLKLQMVGQS